MHNPTHMYTGINIYIKAVKHRNKQENKQKASKQTNKQTNAQATQVTQPNAYIPTDRNSRRDRILKSVFTAFLALSGVGNTVSTLLRKKMIASVTTMCDKV